MTELATEARKETFVFGSFRLDITDRVLRKSGEPLPIRGRALELLIVLLERAGEVVSQKELISKAWHDVTIDPSNLRAHIASLRRTFDLHGDGSRYIATVSGRGYCFVAPVQPSTDDLQQSFGEHPTASKPSQLPAPLTRMIGREETVGNLCTELITHRFVTIVGAGGVGKTTVAIAAAHAFTEQISIPACFVDLTALADPKSLPSMVGSALGCPLKSHDLACALITFLNDKPHLLVLDNCETAPAAAAELAERMHRHVARVHILTTSREALRATGEHPHILSPLDCPPNGSNLTTAATLSYPAAQLFVARAAAAGLRMPLRDLDAAEVARICRRLDGIPLALELAAGRVGSLGLSGTADLLDSSFALAWKGRRTSINRHQTIATMLDWSFRLLSERERAVLCKISVFIGPFTAKLAVAVAMDANGSRRSIEDALAGLVAKSLISAIDHHGETRYRLLETTRAYAALKLEEQGEANDVYRKHAATFIDLLQGETGPRSVFDSSELQGYDIYVDNIRAALGWALSERGNPELGIRLVPIAAALLIRMSFFDECRRSCQRALALLPEQERGKRLEMLLQEALSHTSMFTRGNSEEVKASLERGLAIATELHDYTQQLHFLAGLNTFLYRTGDFRGALAVARQARTISRRHNLPAGQVTSEWMLGVAYHCVGSQDAAQRHCQRGFAHSKNYAVHDPSFFGYDHRVRALVGLAGTLWLRGYANRATSTAEQAIREAEVRRHPISICISLYTAQVFLRAGLVQRAAELSDRLSDYATHHGLDPFRFIGLAFKGEVALHNGELTLGTDLLRQALASLDSEQHNILRTVFSGALAEGLMRLRRFDEALVIVDEAIHLAKGSGAGLELAELLRIKAEILAEKSQLGSHSAIDAIRRSLEVGKQQAALAYQLRSATTFARLEDRQGRDHGARAVVRSVYEQFTEGFEAPDLLAARLLLDRLGKSDPALDAPSSCEYSRG